MHACTTIKTARGSCGSRTANESRIGRPVARTIRVPTEADTESRVRTESPRERSWARRARNRVLPTRRHVLPARRRARRSNLDAEELRAVNLHGQTRAAAQHHEEPATGEHCLLDLVDADLEAGLSKHDEADGGEVEVTPPGAGLAVGRRTQLEVDAPPDGQEVLSGPRSGAINGSGSSVAILWSR